MPESQEHDYRVTASPAPEGLSELIQLREQMRASEGWAFGVDMKNLQRTWNVFHLNWTHLDSLVGRFKSDTQFALDLWDINDRSKWDGFLDALDLPLHNYIAAAATLGDHTRIVAQRRLHGDGWDRYQAEVNDVFGNRPRSRFIKDFRNYMLHYALPVTFGSMEYVKDGPFTHAITLHVDSLRRWDGWKPKALEYLDAAGETLDLHDAVAGYYRDTRTFQEWFGRHVYVFNREAVDEGQRIADEGNELAEQLRPRLEATREDEVEIPFISWGFNRPS